MARIYNTDKSIFAEYLIDKSYSGSNLDFISSKDTFAFVHNNLLINRHIILDNEDIGSIYLHSGLDDYAQRINNFIKVFIIILITAFAGYVGLVLGVGLLQLVADNLQGASYFANPEVDINIALGATLILVVSGALAGFVPARKAASVKPVIALRDE